MSFFRRLYYLLYFYPQVLWAYYKMEHRLALPFKFNDWHHRTIYLNNRTHFIKCYLDKGRGQNESRVNNYLSAQKFKDTPELLKFVVLMNLEILVFQNVRLKSGVIANDIELIENRLENIGVSHGDVKKNVFYSGERVFVIDFAFSTVDDEFLYKEIPEKYLSERAENFTGKVLFFGTGADTFREILDTISVFRCFKVNFHRTLFQRLVINILVNLSPHYFTKYIVKKYELKKYQVELLVLFDFPHASKLDVPYLKTLFAKVCLYYWNPVTNVSRLNEEIKIFDDVWSFSSFDCEKYNLRYNGQFYKVKNSYCTELEDFDIFYIGRIKKNREMLLSKYLSVLEDKGLSLKIILIGTTENTVLKKYLSDPIPYPEVIGYIRRSRAILDITSVESGLSLRPLEALFYYKKIISNINLSDFSNAFDSNNVLLLDLDSCDEMHPIVRENCRRTELKYFNENFSVDRFVLDFINV
jgi:hypothetical protein